MILVIGTGVAGLSCALAAAGAGADVALVSAGRLGADAIAGGSTALAQGGIAAAVGPGDSVDAHLADTIAAGAGLVDAEAAAVLVREGARAVRELIEAGLPVDRDASGAVSLGLEAAHGAPRIVHSGGDRTGAALHAFLVTRVLAEVRAGRIRLIEGRRVESLLQAGGAVRGAVLGDASENAVFEDARPGEMPRPRSPEVRSPEARSRPSAAPERAHAEGARTEGARTDEVRSERVRAEGSLAEGPSAEIVRAEAVVLATGGYAALYPRTSNPSGARGDGIVVAARAGALVADLEFVQFHPTVLHGTGALVSEAVRGAGAVLLDGSGRRFMADAAWEGSDPRAELAPRDVVSRGIHRVLRERGEGCVRLDATGIEAREGSGALARRFPGISAAVAEHGFDWTREPIPVSPAAHYTMGGVLSDLDGRSTVPGLFVAGEIASTGVHGANRLASNSLLEGLVFGGRAGRAAAAYARGASAGAVAGGGAGTGRWALRGGGARSLVETAETVRLPAAAPDARADAAVARAVSEALGIERDATGLREAQAEIAGAGGAAAELAAMMLHAAASRTESRGAHQRSDHPDLDPGQGRRRAFRFVRSAAPGAALRYPVQGGVASTRTDPSGTERSRPRPPRSESTGTDPTRPEQRSLASC